MPAPPDPGRAEGRPGKAAFGQNTLHDGGEHVDRTATALALTAQLVRLAPWSSYDDDEIAILVESLIGGAG